MNKYGLAVENFSWRVSKLAGLFHVEQSSASQRVSKSASQQVGKALGGSQLFHVEQFCWLADRLTG